IVIPPAIFFYYSTLFDSRFKTLQQNPHVYPLYDELKALRGLNGVKDHLSYVRGKQEAYSKRNIAKYLKKAIEQYLPTVKRQDIENE
ncbi:hypothetical protein ABVL85_15270, partial [Enterococcus gallinarum]